MSAWLGPVIGCLMVASLAVSGKQLFHVSHAATGLFEEALLTAVGFVLLGVVAHSNHLTIQSVRPQLVAVTYGLKTIVAIYLSVMANAPVIRGVGSDLATHPNFVDLVQRLWAAGGTPVVLTCATLFWVLLFDAIVLLLDRVRDAVAASPPGPVAG
jgi:hypothetical protein